MADPLALPSSRFFRKAARLGLRGGAVTAALAEMRAAAGAAPVLSAVPEVSPSTLALISDHPGFPGIEYAGG